MVTPSVAPGANPVVTPTIAAAAAAAPTDEHVNKIAPGGKVQIEGTVPSLSNEYNRIQLYSVVFRLIFMYLTVIKDKYTLIT